jgi:outer membrane protein TolC
MLPRPFQAALAAGLAAAAHAAGAQAPRGSTTLPAVGDTVLVSLPDAVARVLRVGDETRIAEAQLDATEAQVTTARATGLPQLNVTGAYTQVLQNARATIVGQVFNQPYTYQTNARLSQTLFQGGRIVNGIRAANRSRAASREDLAEVQAQATVDVQRAYLGVLAAEQLVAIQERNLALSDQRVAQAEQLEKGGRAARYDVLRARVERTNLEPLAIQARNDRDLALLELKRLINLAPETPLRLTSRVATDSGAVLALLRQAMADVGAPTRPAVRAAESVADARDAGVKVARADFLPNISAFFQTGLLALPATAGFPTRFGQTSAEFCPPGSTAGRVCQNNGFYGDKQLGVQVSWPLFDGLRAKGNLDLAQAQARVADLQLAQTRERVATEAARARAGLSRATALYSAQQENVQQAEEAFRLASLRFERGMGTPLEVSDAQLALLTARTNALRATLDAYLAVAEQARALGRTIPLVSQP